jgi:PAS domain S-box-containing protein
VRFRARRRDEDELDERYRLLVEEMPLALYVAALHETSHALYVSPAIVDLLGHDLREWRTNPALFEQLVHPDERARVLERVAAARRSGSPYEAEYRMLHADGSVVWVQDHAVTVHDGDGRPLHWQGFLVDVTARKDAEARYRALVEQLPLITYMDSPAAAGTTSAYISPQVETLLGYPLDDWRADPDFFEKHLHPADRDRVMSEQRAARASGEPLQLEYRFIARDGSTVWLQDSFTIVHDEDGRPWYSQGFALDVTGRKAAEQDREMLLRQAQVQNEQLRRLDRMKDEFIALVSHELRTPLTSIRGYLELILEDLAHGGVTAEQQREFLQVIDRNSDRLQRLVEDLLLAAQVEVGTLHLVTATIDLGELVADCVEASAPAAAAREIALGCSIDDAPSVSGDLRRLGQVIDNLLSNALKFTPPGGVVHVRASRRDSTAVVEVSDTGMGIPDEEQESLFGRFYRTERAQHDAIPGVGLGLSITKSIVEAHGGTITFTSAAGAGTTFVVELPAS